MDESELDLVAFLAETTGSDVSQMERLYRRTRDTFDFRGQAYRTLMLETVPALFACLVPGDDDAAVIQRYQIIELLYLYRMVSYEAQEKKARRSLADQIASPAELATWARSCGKAVGDMRLLDYGCGSASRSLALARRHSVHVTLADLDTVGLRFAGWRMRKYGVAHQVITITAGRLYPDLPPCDAAILFNSLEHLRDPTRALQQIHSALSPGGYLKINNIQSVQKTEWQHLSPDMKEARAWLIDNMNKVASTVFRKRGA